MDRLPDLVDAAPGLGADCRPTVETVPAVHVDAAPDLGADCRYGTDRHTDLVLMPLRVWGRESCRNRALTFCRRPVMSALADRLASWQHSLRAMPLQRRDV